MHESFKNIPVIDCHNLTDIFCEEMGLPNHRQIWYGHVPLTEAQARDIEIIGDIVWRNYAQIYGNESFERCDNDTFYYDAEEYADENEKDADRINYLAKKVSEIADKKFADGTFPEEFYSLVCW